MDKIVASIDRLVEDIPASLGEGPRCVKVDLLPTLHDGLEAWIAKRPDPQPTPPEAVVHILSLWLGRRGYLRDAAKPPA